jgi:cytochrome c-type biogenesis protein CcmH/NrfG
VKQGRFGEAEALFKEALKLDPSVAQYHVALAHALTKARGLSGAAEAKDALDKALALNPEHNAARVLKAQVLTDEGDFKGAMKLLDAVLGSDPMHADAGRAFRTLKERMAGSKSKGLFGKLFGK